MNELLPVGFGDENVLAARLELRYYVISELLDICSESSFKTLFKWYAFFFPIVVQHVVERIGDFGLKLGEI